MATISDLAERLARVETTLEHILDRLDRMSDQGGTPTPKSGGWSLRIARGSGREIAIIVFAILGGVGGPLAGMLLQQEPAAAEADGRGVQGP